MRVRTVLGGTAAALLALTAVPALATDEPVEAAEPELLQECSLPDGAERLTLGGATGTIDTPSLVGETATFRTFVLDLAGEPVGTTAAVDTTMTWLVPANDYDLEVLAGRASGLSENSQPLDPAEENVLVSGLAHCQRVEVSAIDFLAPVVVDTLDLAVTVTATRPVA